ncbi:MAG: hypothetical protein KME15_21235 [Drouetiella hepatica Uher 2000/2452]|jgi:hypothetical protein|uniref:Uncharacterized protein n=1 Tax=Drouetiella hepatica Uher 2000/2452 TaxID=904376 RepID=A0A951QFS1_9CYAN|nr:hypothetical protein [Drouetiella hepatica Uher 2000/2452]
MYYKSLSITPKAFDRHWRNQPTCAAEAAVYLSAYFFHLRAVLDKKRLPAIIVDRPSGSILSINLPAFELLAIDAVGLRLLDFSVDQEIHRWIDQQIQTAEKSRQPVLLHNADGCRITCKVNAKSAPGYSGWAILGLEVNQAQP